MTPFYSHFYPELPNRAKIMECFCQKGKNKGVCTEMRVSNLSIAAASKTAPEPPVCAKNGTPKNRSM